MKNKKNNKKIKNDKDIVLVNFEKNKKMIYLQTPSEFIKERKKGGKIFKYVEGGYVISRLNEIFGTVNWDFQVKREIILDKSVAVYGELTVKGFFNNNVVQITKGQYGQKERYDEISIGDTLKAAATDALKKCASLFGVALDVYWQDLDAEILKNKEGDGGKNKEKNKTINKVDKKELFRKSLELIKQQDNILILREWIEKIKLSNIYDTEQKQKLISLIESKIKLLLKKLKD